jgi:hypothetical protein
VVISQQSAPELQEKALLLLEIVNRDLGSIDPIKGRLGYFKVRVIFRSRHIENFMLLLALCLFE